MTGIPYTIKTGDSLSRIAEKFKFRTWQEIYDHPWNNEFKSSHPNPSLIRPGEVLWIPLRTELAIQPQDCYIATSFDPDAPADSANTIRTPDGVRLLFAYADYTDEELQSSTEGYLNDRFLIYWKYDESGENQDNGVNWPELGFLLPQGATWITHGVAESVPPVYTVFENVSLVHGETVGSFGDAHGDTPPPEFALGRIENICVQNAMGKDIWNRYNTFDYSKLHFIEDIREPGSYWRPVKMVRNRPVLIDPLYQQKPELKDLWELNSPAYIEEVYFRYPIDFHRGSLQYCHAQKGVYHNTRSIDKFQPGHTYGFLAQALDMGNFRSKDFDALVQQQVTDKEGNSLETTVATKITIPETVTPTDLFLIKLHCTLPEWDLRISRKADDLQFAIERYKQEIEGDAKQLSRLQQMKAFVSMLINYPYEPQTKENIKAKATLLQEIEKLENHVLKNYVSPRLDACYNLEESQKTQYWLQQIEVEAKALWSLLKRDAFMAELKAYCEAGEDKTFDPQKGPYSHSEPNWTRIFTTLERSYRLLGNTTVHEEVFQEHIQPVFDYLASQAPEELFDKREKEEINRVFLDKKNSTLEEYWENFIFKIQEVSVYDFSEKPTPLLIAIKQSLEKPVQIAGMTIVNAPGPPSLFLELMNVYAASVAKAIGGKYRRNMMATTGYRTLLFFATLFNMGPLSSEQKKAFMFGIRSNNAGKGWRALVKTTAKQKPAAFGTFSDMLVNPQDKSKAHQWTAKGAKGFLTLYSLLNAYTTMESFEIKESGLENLKQCSSLVESTVGAAFSTMLTISKFDKANNLLKGLGIHLELAGKAAEKFTIAMSVVSGAISTYEWYDSLDDGDEEKSWLTGLSAASSFSVPLGYCILGFTPVIGHSLLIAGILVQVGLALQPMIKRMIYEATDLAFTKQLKTFIGEQDSLYYHKYGNDRVEAIKTASEAVQWHHFNWRAIVPLALQGYKLKQLQQLVHIGVSDLSISDVRPYISPATPYSMPYVHNMKEIANKSTWQVEHILGHYLYLVKKGDESESPDSPEKKMAQQMRDGTYTPDWKGFEQTEKSIYGFSQIDRIGSPEDTNFKYIPLK